MPASTDKDSPAIGFLSVLAGSEAGLVGGLLVLNADGRPLEFHCTAPVKANRAQEILYGPSLEPYLYGEQIGQALYKKCKAPLEMIFTDAPAAVALRDYTHLPLAVVLPRESKPADSEGKSLRLDAAHSATAAAPKFARLNRFAIADQPLATHAAYQNDQEQLTSLWSPHAEDFDLLEPFDRIHDAIEEAQRGMRS